MNGIINCHECGRAKHVDFKCPSCEDVLTEDELNDALSEAPAKPRQAALGNKGERE